MGICTDTQITVPVRQLKRVREKIEMYGTEGRFIDARNISNYKAWKEWPLAKVDKLFKKYIPTFEKFVAHRLDFLFLSMALKRRITS